MKNLLKGALLNAFVFPGTGQLALRRYTRGWLYIAVGVGCLFILVRVIIATVTSVFANSTAGELGTDIDALTGQVRAELLQNGGTTANYALIVLILVWVIALIDAIVTGTAEDRRTPERDQE